MGISQNILHMNERNWGSIFILTHSFIKSSNALKGFLFTYCLFPYSCLTIIRNIENVSIVLFLKRKQEALPEKKLPLVSLLLKLQQTDYKLGTLFVVLLLSHINKRLL